MSVTKSRSVHATESQHNEHSRRLFTLYVAMQFTVNILTRKTPPNVRMRELKTSKMVRNESLNLGCSLLIACKTHIKIIKLFRAPMRHICNGNIIDWNDAL